MRTKTSGSSSFERQPKQEPEDVKPPTPDESDGPEESVVAGHGSPADLRALEDLHKRVEKLEEKDRGWLPKVKNLGIVLGVIAAAAALPRTGIELWEIFAREGLRAEFGGDLLVTVSDEEELLTFNLDAVIVNEADRIILLRGARARWSLKDGAADGFVPFSTGDIVCREGGERADFPLAIGGSETLRLDCNVETRWGGRARRLLEAREQQRLEISIETEEERPLRRVYCFELRPEEAAWSAANGAPITYARADCKPFETGG